MTTPQPKFVPQVFRYRDEDNAIRPALVFRKGRTLYHAVTSTPTEIKLAAFPSLRGFVRLPNSPQRTASFWLNHDHRPITKRAKAILKGLVARKKKDLTPGAETDMVAP